MPERRFPPPWTVLQQLLAEERTKQASHAKVEK
jgi:hypothetical protein